MKNWIRSNVIYIIIIASIVIVMTFFMNKKEGFHEDEMFSYGSSNYTWDNVYRPYGKEDATNVLVRTRIAQGNLWDILRNVKYYVFDNREETDAFLLEFDTNRKPIWRTSEEAKDYLTIEGNEIDNYVRVYYNQARDVHPPLFYFLVHTVSVLFYNSFSKYIIFIINIAFMIASLFTIKRIFVSLDKKHLIVPGLIFYGFSMGAISTAIFQRMYAMLTFFCLEFILININIFKNDFQIDRRTWIKLGFVTVLGFLTQYYFCILAVLIAGLMFIKICSTKDKKQIIKYIFNYIKIALIGVIIYPFAINHMFFSYRGVGEAEMKKGFLEKLLDYFSLIGYSYSLPIVFIIGVIVLCTIIILLKRFRRKESINRITASIMIVLSISLILYIAIIVQISPELEYIHTLRYVMSILPIIMMVLLVALDSCFSNHKRVSQVILTGVVIGISILGLVTSEPAFLYKGYNKYLEIAEDNKHIKFVYVGDTVFNHIQSMQEFAIYDESLILNENEIDYVINDEKLKNEKEFILSIKKYKEPDIILEKITTESEFKNYELLLDDDGEVGCRIYRMMR